MATVRRREGEAAEQIGALPGSRMARAFAQGHIDEYKASLRAFIAKFRHEHTDFDALLRGGIDQDSSWSLKQAAPCPATWADYLGTYGFSGPVAEALARVLKDPRQAHPVWFCEAMIAVERADLGLDSLSFDAVRRAIESWREDPEG